MGGMPVKSLWQRGVVWLFLAVWAATWWHPIWPQEQALHNSLTVVAVFALWRWRARWALTASDQALILLFLAVHSVAAHWLYSNVPYEDWTRAVFGFSLNHSLGWQRNQFDRLVHFLYGVCLTPAVCTWMRRHVSASARMMRLLAVGAIVVSSVAYEWIEWMVAVTMTPEAAESYNGQQGDMWDAHKDMLMATLGAAFTSLWLRPASPGTRQAS
jgi:putative membrane protein